MQHDTIRDLLETTRINAEIEAIDEDPAHENVAVVRLRFRDRRDRVVRPGAAPAHG